MSQRDGVGGRRDCYALYGDDGDWGDTAELGGC